MEDLANKYADLSLKSQDEQQRSSFTSEQFLNAATDLRIIISQLSSPPTPAAGQEHVNESASSLLRFLRNSCVQSVRNQALILGSNILMDVVQMIELVIVPATMDKEKKLPSHLQLLLVQFMGNFVVQNHRTQRAVWKAAFPKLFFSMLSNLKDDNLKEVVCMIVYNCLLDDIDILDTEDGRWLVVSIMHHCWGILIDVMQAQMESAEAAQLSSERKIEVKELASKELLKIPEGNLQFLARDFQTRCQCVLVLGSTDEDLLQKEVLLVMKILDLLCLATSHVDKYLWLRSQAELMKIVINLLKQASHEENSAFFSKPCDPTAGRSPGFNNEVDVDSTSPATAVDDSNPVHGFKRDLIRLIGNLCYKSRSMQDLVREEEGILPVLNACRIDNLNPYITQWAVFTVKNLCEGNTSNQDVIHQLEQQGVADNEFLTRTNVKVKLEGGKLTVGNK